MQQQQQDGSGFVELAIQRSTTNPPAEWFWRRQEQIIDKEIDLRVGGSFHWPPLGLDPGAITKLVLIAGGVGMKYVCRCCSPRSLKRLLIALPSPIISILTHLHQKPSQLPPRIQLLYAHRIPSALLESLNASPSPLSSLSRQPQSRPQTIIKASQESFLFLPRLTHLFSSPPFSTSPSNHKATIYLTPTPNPTPKPTRQPLAHAQEEARQADDEHQQQDHQEEQAESFWEDDKGIRPVKTRFGRIQKQDLLNAVGEDIAARKGVVAYVCGPQGMTDAIVDELQGIEGVEKGNVLCEKWW